MNYAIMNKDLKGQYLGKEYANTKAYEQHKRYILSKGSTMYGAVLVLLKQKHVGWNLKIYINWYWIKYRLKPIFSTRFRKEFTWLFLQIFWEKEYIDVPDKIVKDFLKEESVECCSNGCNWKGLKQDCVTPKHVPERLLCPECNEVVE